MNSDYLQIVIALLSGGALQYLSQYIIAKRNTDQTEIQMIIKTWSEDNKRLRDIERENRNRIELLESELSLLRAQIIALESAQIDLPIPMWLKDLTGKMLILNKAYEKSFLEPRGFHSTDYIGKSDIDVWDESTCTIFAYSDNMIRKGKDVYYTTVDIPFTDSYTDKWIVVKYPRLINGDIIGIGGLAIPYNAVIKYNSK